VFALSLAASTPAFGVMVLSANMTHSQETTRGEFLTDDGGPRPESFGTASFRLNDARTELTFTASIFNIDITGSQTPDDANDDLLAAHIHAAPDARFGQNSPVVWGFFGAPDNDTTPDDLVVTPFSSGVGGTISSKWDAPEGNNATTLADQLPNILTGHSYINFHTTQFRGGEIRGTIVPDGGSSILLLGCSLVGMAAIQRKLRGS
jgi:hypothetical protein